MEGLVKTLKLSAKQIIQQQQQQNHGHVIPILQMTAILKV